MKNTGLEYLVLKGVDSCNRSYRYHHVLNDEVLPPSYFILHHTTMHSGS